MTNITQNREGSSNPIFGSNKLKLGVFGFNCSQGCAISDVEEGLTPTWSTVASIATKADAMGIEGLVPIARWKGFGGRTNFNGNNLETYTWAAGVGANAHYAGVFATSHVPTVHPVVAAKQAVTIDHITNGRFGLNVVCGWFVPEFKMFGTTLLEHDERYVYASEWLDIVQRLWSSEEEFDFEGKYFKIEGGISEPKPIQRPFPPIMNAGGSGAGQLFSAKYSDMAFLILKSHEHDGIKAQVDAYRKLAFDEFKRGLQLWTHAYVVIRDTEKEAKDYLNYYVVERGDDEAVHNLIGVKSKQSGTLANEAAYEAHKFHFKAGWGGVPLVGTAEQVVEQMQVLSSAGIDGILLTFVDYEDGLDRTQRQLLPLMEQAGLRQRFA
jgi:FMNH2-dependent dimethyl sulfone monooxygenase